MTSEIRANIIKNRVGLGTIEYSNTGPIISGVTTALNFKTGTSNLHNTGLSVQDLDVDGHTNLDNVSVAGVSTFSEGLFVPDNKKIEIGNTAGSGDVQIYHSSNHSYLENSTGELRINNTSGSDMILNSTGRVQLQVANGEKAVYCDNNGAVELYHNGSKKFETTSAAANFTVASNGQVNLFGLGGTNGLRISGPQSASSAFLFFNTNHQNVSGGTDQYTIQCGGANHTLMFKHGNSTGNVVFELDDSEHARIPQDGKALKIGAGQDLQLQHDGTNSHIVNHTGSFNLRSDNLRLTDANLSHVYLKGTSGGSTDLYYDNVKTFETTNEGVTLHTNTTSTILRLNSNTDAVSMLQAVGNNLYVKAPSSGSIYMIGNGNEVKLSIYSNGKLATNSASSVDCGVGGLHLYLGDGARNDYSTAADGLIIEKNGTTGLSIDPGSSGTANIYFPNESNHSIASISHNNSTGELRVRGEDHIVLSTNGNTERLRITSGGQVRIGNDDNLALWGQNNRLQVAGTDWNTSGVTIAKMGNSTATPNLIMGSSRGSTPGTAINNGDRLGYISFVGDDGTDMHTVGAAIVAGTDAAPSSNNIPGTLQFYTGSNTSTEKLRIGSDGTSTFDVGAPSSSNKVIGRFQAQSSRQLDIVWHDSGSLMGFNTPGNHSYIFKCNNTERLRITSDGKMGLNHNSPSSQFVVRAPGGSGHCSSQVHSGDSSTIMNMQTVQATEGRFGMNTNHDLAIYTNGLEKARLSKTGSLFLKCLDTVPVNQAESGHYNSTGYNAGHALGLMVKRSICVSDADTKGVGGIFLSHTRNVACNGTTYNMMTLHNREGTFVGDVYIGFSVGGAGTVRHYKFTCLYASSNATSIDYVTRGGKSESISLQISTSNDSHFFQVIPNMSTNETARVTMTIVGAACGRNDGVGGDYYTVNYN